MLSKRELDRIEGEEWLETKKWKEFKETEARIDTMINDEEYLRKIGVIE